MLKSHGTETRGGYVRAQLVIAPSTWTAPWWRTPTSSWPSRRRPTRSSTMLCRGKILYDPEMVERNPHRCSRAPRGGAGHGALQGALRQGAVRQHDHARCADSRWPGMDYEAMKRAMLEVIPRFHEQNLARAGSGPRAARRRHPRLTCRPGSSRPPGPGTRPWPSHLPSPRISRTCPAGGCWSVTCRASRSAPPSASSTTKRWRSGADAHLRGALDRGPRDRHRAAAPRRRARERASALCLPNSAALIVGYYATWYAGGRRRPDQPARDARASSSSRSSDAGVSLVIADDEAASDRRVAAYAESAVRGYGGVPGDGAR